MTLSTLDRRKFLLGASAMAIFAGLGAPGRLLAAPRLEHNPFSLGVASGDPWPDGFVIWTRLAPSPLAEHGGMPMHSVPVLWEVAEDPLFRRIVRSGQQLARPELGHSVHVELSGLQPQRPYWYRFHLQQGASSSIGKVRTAAATGARVERLRIAVAGCQHYETGLFTAYAHLAGEPDLDAVFHYGDYIYEGAGRQVKSSIVRSHASAEIYSLDDYRRRYALYKSDPDLQAAHAAVAFISSFDDHEVDNNWTAALDQDGVPSEIFLLRRQAALQAWYENMPVRRSQFPRPDGLRMHRRLAYGDLLRIHVLDTRQYRSKQPCDPSLIELGRTCLSPAQNTAQHVLGSAQEQWLAEGLDSQPARWNLLAQQVMMMPFQYPGSRAAGAVNGDSWSGYPDARQRVTDLLAQRNLGNVIVATGDVHKHHAGVVPANAEDPLGRAVASEYVSSSISSNGDGTDMPDGWEGVSSANPHAAWFNDRRGYQIFTVDKDQWQTDVVSVDYVSTPGAGKQVAARLLTEHGRPGVHHI